MTPSSCALAPANPLLQAYSEQVLQWQLGQGGATPLPREDAFRAQQAVARVIASAGRAGHRHVLVLGLGDGTMAGQLRQKLPADCTLLVLEDQPAVARAALAHTPELHPHVLVDSSPWALFLLCQALGVPSGQCTLCYNPVYARKCSTGLPVLEQWRRLFLGAHVVSLPDVTASTYSPVSSGIPSTLCGAETGAAAQPRLSVACIAHPAEATVPEFFSHIPPWVHELVVVWDGHPPASVPACAVPLRQVVRPLNGDFAAQRNAMVERCTGEWCLYLDVDERLDATTWAAIPPWLTLPTAGPHAVGGIVLPRLTFMGDAKHVRMGYGLWPDVQTRLFPLYAGAEGSAACAGQGERRFVGAVHEQLSGLHGARLLVGGHGIWHYSHIRKDAATLQERLQVFNAAAALAQAGEGGTVLPDAPAATTAGPRHVLSAAYPRLPLGYFTDLQVLFQSQGQGAWLLPL